MDLTKQPHYKLYVRLNETILLDGALFDAQIEHRKEAQTLGHHIRYYFLKKDAEKITDIAKKLGLSLSTETVFDLEHDATKKTHVLYVFIALIVAFVIALAVSFFH